MDEFLGTHTPRLDDKGRLLLPARFRPALAEGLVVTTGQEGCLYVFPTAEFHRISALMQAAPGSSRQVRDFAKAMGRLAKTDALDARVLAHFAAVTRAEPKPLPDETARELDALLDRRRQLIGMRTMERNRLASAAGRVRRDLESHLRWLERHIHDVDRELDERAVA